MFPHRRIKMSIVLSLFSVLIVLATLTFEISARQANQRSIQTQPIHLGEDWPGSLLERKVHQRHSGGRQNAQSLPSQDLNVIVAF